MTSGTLTALMLIALSATSPAQVEEPQQFPEPEQVNEPQRFLEPEQLLENLDLAHDRLAFSETRTSELLNEPLEVTGEFRLREDQALVRETQAPFVETQILGADYVEVRRPNQRRRRFSLIRAPELTALRDVLLAIMSGNTGPLENEFDMIASGHSGAWSLELRPRADRVADRLSALVLSGSDQRLDQLELIMTDGERIRTRLHSTP